mmetsp:Transcript_65847/g.157364  ORF Transcript_65847/g.157364 Transcript_65847/m.157364 type:complete len:94 (-) Transcript_65847:98-379(-)
MILQLHRHHSKNEVQQHRGKENSKKIRGQRMVGEPAEQSGELPLSGPQAAGGQGSKQEFAPLRQKPSKVFYKRVTVNQNAVSPVSLANLACAS